MLILWRSKQKDPSYGYARTFIGQVEQVLGTCLDRDIRIVANAGGLNPAGLAERLRELAEKLGLDASIAHIEGDDLLDRMDAVDGVPDGAAVLTSNAYLGGWGIARALGSGADIVVCPRVTDASLVVGPAAWRYGWTRDDWDRLASMVVAGHIIECGAQATGGNYAFFTEVEGLIHPGFPIVEVEDDGTFVVTKHEGTGGAVTVGTVTAQLLYEIGGPRYANPDVVARFDSIRLEEVGTDRVRVSGVRGEPAPDIYKVCVNTFGGFRNAMTFVLAGLDRDAKADLALASLRDRIDLDGIAEVDIRRLPAGEDIEHLRVVVEDPDQEKVGRAFSGAVVELALASYPGYHITAPPSGADPYGVYVPGWVDKPVVEEVVVTADGDRVVIEPVLAGGSIDPGPETAADASSSRGTAESVGEPASAGGTAAGSSAAGAPGSPTERAPLGLVAGARSGDKGGDANVGVWVRTDEAYPWLRDTLTVERFRELYPEAADLEVRRYELPNLRALNFVAVGLLGQGVSSSTRPDPQAKAVGEELRAQHLDIPTHLLPSQA